MEDMKEQEVDLQNDEVTEFLKELRLKDNEKVLEMLNEIVPFIYKILDEKKEEGYEIKHAFLSLAATMSALTQRYYESKEDFDTSFNKCNDFVSKRFFNIYESIAKGNDEEFDKEMLSLVSMINTVAIFIDKMFWRIDLGTYISRREANEAVKANETINN